MKVMRWAAAAIVLGVWPPQLLAQPATPNLDAYNNAVRVYLTGGDLAPALVPLRAFAPEHFEAAAARIIASGDRALITAAAIFELEIGVGTIAVAPDTAAAHFALGRSLIDQLVPPRSAQTAGLMKDVQAMRATWYGVAASAFLFVGDSANARVWISRALELQPDAAPLRTIQGAMHELDATSINPGVFLTGNQKTRAFIERRRRLQMAENAFRDAVRADPAYTTAEIRLGRSMFLLDDVSEAQAVLERAESRARQPGDRFLAAMFLGAVHQRRDEPAQARAAYERALAAVPRSQAAVVALSQLELMTGRIERARSLARELLESEAPADRFWMAYRRGGVDEAGLAWLRQRVRP